MAPTDKVHPDALELAELLRPSWPTIRAGIRASGAPTCEGEPDPPADPESITTPGDGDADPITPDDSWQEKARKHERDLKRERRAREKLEEQLAQHTEASQSEQEKALERARKEAVAEASSEVTAKFRGRILEAEIRAAAAGLFADADDAVRLADVDLEEAFGDDDEINRDLVTSALNALLERKPHLRAAASPPPIPDPDAGKGDGNGFKTLNEQIREAEQAGDVRRSISLKNQKLLAARERANS